MLEEMPDQHLKDLLKKLSTEKSSGPATEESAGNEEGEDAELGADELESEEIPVADGAEVEEEVFDTVEEEDEATTLTEADRLRQRALAWATRAVEVGGFIKKPKGKRQDLLYLYEKEREKKARILIKRALDQGEFYLIPRGGTPKGSGPFYPRPPTTFPIPRPPPHPRLS